MTVAGAGANSATPGIDVSPVTQAFTVSAGRQQARTLASVTLDIADDGTLESPETFQISLSWTGSGGYGIPSARGITIYDNEAQFSITGPAAVDEGGAAPQFSIARRGNPTTGTIAWTINHGTAADATDSPTADADFSAVTGMVSFEDINETDDVTKTFSINLVDDSIAEGTENFNIGLMWSPSGGASRIDPTTVTVTALDSSITDNDGDGAMRTLTLTLLDGSGGSAATTSIIAESDSDAAVYYSAGISSGPAFADATELMWTITPGDPSVSGESVTAANDFAAVTGAFTMPASPATQTEFFISVAGDNRNEDTEYFTVSIAGGGVQASSGVTAGILDDDQVIVTISSSSFVEGTTPTMFLDLGAELTRPFQVRPQIWYADTSGGAYTAELADTNAGTQWVPLSPPRFVAAQVGITGRPHFTIPAGQSTGSILLHLFGANGNPSGIFATDRLNEADEMFQIDISEAREAGASPYGSFVRANTATWTIIDNDDMTVVVTATAGAVAEGSSVQFDITLEGAASGSDGNMDLLYMLTGLEGVGITPDDPGNGTLRINRLQTTGSVTVSIPSTDTLSAMSPEQTLSLVVTGVRAAPTNPASGSVDPVIGRVTAAAPDNRASVAVQWTGFAHAVTLTSPPATVAEDSGGAAGTATYVLTRTGPALTNPLQITWSVDPGTAQDADFTATTGAVEFSGTETSKEVAVFITGDDLNEASETFTIRFAVDRAAAAAAGSVSLPGPHETTITDDDAISAGIEVISPDAGSATGHQLAETTFAQFRITMDHASAADATIQYDISGDVETADYAGETTRTVVIRAGETSAVVTIQILADADTDASEAMTVALTASGHSAAGVIARSGNAGERSVTVQITELMAVRTLGVERVGEFYVDETDGTVMADYRARVASGMAFNNAADLRWFVTHGDASVSTRSATTAEDFDGGSATGTFRINSGTGVTANFAVPIAGDNRNEDTEYFAVNLVAVNPGGDSGTNPTTTGVVTGIRDDDQVIITMGGGHSFPEGTPDVDVVVDFGAELTRPFRARVLILRNDENSTLTNPAHNSIETGNDFDSGTSYIPAGPPIVARSQLAASQFVALAGATTFSFPLSRLGDSDYGFPDDNLNEADEVFWVTLSDVISPAVSSAPGSGVWGDVVFPTPRVTTRDGVWDPASLEAYTLLDVNPIDITVTASVNTVAEGGSVRFDITLTGASEGSDGNFDVLYTLDGLGAGITPGDAGNGSLRFNRLQTAGTVTVSVPYTAERGSSDDDSTLAFRITGVEKLDTPPTLVNGTEHFDHAAGVITSTAPNNQASVTVTWTDDTPDHVFTLDEAPATIAEPAAAQGAPATFEVERGGPDLATTLGVTWRIQTAGAAAEDFHGATQGTLSFFGNTTTQTFVVNAAHDDLNEGDEDFTINFTVSDPA
ncbi:MAG: hypothetical protein OXU61_07750, partial [Gammaproteobacteria bacterium]|nr:hypothetical protein [Gammaproteobacteria bacterium]